MAHQMLVLGAGLAACCSVSAAADKPKLQIAQLQGKVEPIAMQRAILNPDGSVTTVGELIPYTGGSGGGGGGRTNWGLAFDNFEPDSTGWPTDGAAAGGYDPVCFELGAVNRWYFGTGYNNKFTANDMICAPEYDGSRAQRLEYTVYMSEDEEHLQIGIWTAQRFSDDCEGFDRDGDGVPDLGVDDLFEGVIYTFGFLGSSGYYVADIDLSGTGLYHQLPTGPGGYLIGFYGDDDGDGRPDRFANAGQSMLWGTKPIGNNSYQGLLQWDDDDPEDGMHTAFVECDTYDYGVCPDPLGAMMAFYGGPADPCYADCYEDGVVNTLDFICFLGFFSAGDPAADCDENGVVNTLDFLCFLNAFNAGC